VEDNISMDELEDVAESAGSMEALVQPGSPTIEPETSYLVFNLEQLLIPLTNLFNLDTCEVYLRSRKNGELERIFHTGKLENIWQPEGTGENGTFYKSFLKGEARTFSLPSLRSSSQLPNFY
jgi:hypothetical protein